MTPGHRPGVSRPRGPGARQAQSVRYLCPHHVAHLVSAPVHQSGTGARGPGVDCGRGPPDGRACPRKGNPHGARSRDCEPAPRFHHQLVRSACQVRVRSPAKHQTLAVLLGPGLFRRNSLQEPSVQSLRLRGATVPKAPGPHSLLARSPLERLTPGRWPGVKSRTGSWPTNPGRSLRLHTSCSHQPPLSHPSPRRGPS